MTDRTDLEKLSNQEIRELWKRTTDRARKLQAERQQNARPDEQAEEGYYRDQFGNIIEGKKPAPKTDGHFIDPRGFVQELAPGEKPPALSGNGLVDWLNNQNIAEDPELKQALGDNLYFEGQTTVGESEIVLTGRLESKGWIVDSRSPDNPELNLAFRLSRDLTRDEAVAESIAYVESKTGPIFKTFSENEERMIERMAVTNRLQAFVFYIQARLPEDLATRFLELGEAGDELGRQKFAADAKISEIVEEAAAYAFFWNNSRATEEFFEWVRNNDGGRLWSLVLLDSLWTRYWVSSNLEKLDAQDAPTAEELEQMSDEEIEKTLTEARRLRARNQVR